MGGRGVGWGCRGSGWGGGGGGFLGGWRRLRDRWVVGWDGESPVFRLGEVDIDFIVIAHGSQLCLRLHRAGFDKNRFRIGGINA